MARRQRKLPVRALGRLTLALLGGGGIPTAALLPSVLVSAQAAAEEPPPKPASRVRIHIFVIEATKKGGDFDKRLASLKIAMPGYQGARIVDELKTEAPEGGTVSLPILKDTGAARVLAVTVKRVEPNKTVQLRIAIDALKFSTDTKHEKGGTFVVHHTLSSDKGLFLAVTPTVE